MTSVKQQAEAAREALDAAREVLGRWEADHATAVAELESLQERAGVEVLDSPDAAEKLPKVMGELRDRIDIVGRAIGAQRPRVVEAERVYLLAEAEVLDRRVQSARAALERHQERTAVLLKALEEHEGPYVPKVLLDEATAEPGSYRSFDLPRSEQLQAVVDAAERPVLALREMAAGRAPSAHPALREFAASEVLPACVWGPDAVVPGQEWLRQLAAVDGVSA